MGKGIDHLSHLSYDSVINKYESTERVECVIDQTLIGSFILSNHNFDKELSQRPTISGQKVFSFVVYRNVSICHSL